MGGPMLTLHEGDLIAEFQSAYGKEYFQRPLECHAGHLMESVKHNHQPTSRYEFTSERAGHHFYKELENVADEPIAPAQISET